MIEAYIEATNAGDTAAVLALSEPDVRIWHNFDDLEVDGEASARTLRWLHDRVGDLAWSDSVVTPTATGFVWQATITGSAPGGPLLAHTCSVITVSPAGKIARVEEYLDPAQLAALRE